jgi:hypothetical protein
MPLVRGWPSLWRRTAVPVYRTAAIERPEFQVAEEGTFMTMKKVAYFALQVPTGRSSDSRMVLPGNWYVAVAAGLNLWASMSSI